MRRVKQGEVLFREGDYGSTAFYFWKGRSISSSPAACPCRTSALEDLHILKNKLVAAKNRRPTRISPYSFHRPPVELSTTIRWPTRAGGSVRKK